MAKEKIKRKLLQNAVNCQLCYLISTNNENKLMKDDDGNCISSDNYSFYIQKRHKTKMCI